MRICVHTGLQRLFLTFLMSARPEILKLFEHSNPVLFRSRFLPCKNRQCKAMENAYFPILVNAMCHLFAGMCPPIVDMGSLPPCDPLLGLKAYVPQRRAQHTIPH